MNKVKEFLSGSKEDPASGRTETTDEAAVGPSSDNTKTNVTDPENPSSKGTALSGSELPDRSVHQSTTNTQPTLSEANYHQSESHPTFTGSRLDPAFKESTPTYHAEALNDETHHGGGWISGTSGATASAAQTHSGSSAAQTHPDSSATAVGSGDNAEYNTGPASNTTGPHKSNVANIVDPRVQPDLSATSKRDTGATTTSSTGAAAAAAETRHAEGSKTEPTSHEYADSKPFAAHSAHKTTGEGERDLATDASAGTNDATSSAVSDKQTAHNYHDAGLALGPGGAGAAGMAGYETKDDPKVTQDASKTLEHGTRKHTAADDTTSPGALTDTAPHEAETSHHEGEEKKSQGFLNKILHRDHPNKLHKDPPS